MDKQDSSIQNSTKIQSFPCFLPNPTSILLGLYENWKEKTDCTEEEQTIICEALRASVYTCSITNKPRLESISYSIYNAELNELSRLTNISISTIKTTSND